MNLTHLEIEWLKKRYFSDPTRQFRLEKGERLLSPGQFNDKLFLVLDGTLSGFLEYDSEEPFEIFRSGQDNLVGAYSFFAGHHQSYSTVIAAEDTALAFVQMEQMSEPEYAEFARNILPVVVEEIYMRQLLALRLHQDKEQAMRRLYQSEKLATLGQLAAGLAHELNNAVGAIQLNGETIAHQLEAYFQTQENSTFFQKGLHKGLELSSAEVRQSRKDLEAAFNIPAQTAKRLAKLGLQPADLHAHRQDLEPFAEKISWFFELGMALHDMLLATRHAGEVVRSVKELGTANRRAPSPTDLNQTLREALVLLEKPIKKIKVVQDLKPLPQLLVNGSDWVQVWVNLMKNGCEAMLNASVNNPTLTLRSEAAAGFIKISIQDNGTGVPEDLQEKIFQPNFTTKVDGLSFGLGLGLSIVQRIVQGYNGRLELESRPGRTVFSVLLPIVDLR